MLVVQNRRRSPGWVLSGGAGTDHRAQRERATSLPLVVVALLLFIRGTYCRAEEEADVNVVGGSTSAATASEPFVKEVVLKKVELPYAFQGLNGSVTPFP